MKRKPTSDISCSAELIHCDDFSTKTILNTLIRAPKGPEHVLVIDGSHDWTRAERNRVKASVRSRLDKEEVAYELYFYSNGPCVVCYWKFVHEHKKKLKKWFDTNAELGLYPEFKLRGI